MKYILKFILWKMMSRDFWLLVAGSLAMYTGWQLRGSMREAIWRSYRQGPIHSHYKSPF